MSNATAKAIVFVGLIVVWGAIALGFNYLIWLMYSWFMLQVWPLGPTNIVQPSWTLFLVGTVLIGFVAGWFKSEK